MAIEDYCCQCGEETGFKDGYMIWETFDGKYGHKYCVETYDQQNKTKIMKIKEKIEKLESKIYQLDDEKKKCQFEIKKLTKELNEIKEVNNTKE